MASGMMSGVAHEFRTPLNIIIGFTELMLEEIPGKINDEQRRDLTDILNSARHLLKLVNDIGELPGPGGEKYKSAGQSAGKP